MPVRVVFKSEEASTRSEAASILRQLADKLESGHIVLHQRGSETFLSIPRDINLEVKAEREEMPCKPCKLSLEIELDWEPANDNLDYHPAETH